MAYKHGVYTSEEATSLVAMSEVDAGIPVVFGTSPVHRVSGWTPGDKTAVNKVILCYSYSEAVLQLGFEADDWDKYTLSEFVKCAFALYGIEPVIFINVFDPDVHKKTVEDEGISFADGDTITLANADILPGTFVLTSSDGATTYEQDVDYELDEETGELTRIKADDGGSIAEGASLLASYDYADPSQVTSDDIIGGIDADTGDSMGLELIDRVFPQTGLIPGTICAPKWSTDPVVAIYMGAKTEDINEHFSCMCAVDISTTECPKYTDLSEYKNANSLDSENMIVCWPQVVLDDTFHLSTFVACIMAKVDSKNDDVPFVSPSNQSCEITGGIANGEEIWLGPEQANYCNGQGIVTVLNFIGSWRVWGNRTGAYPANTDPKDSFIPIRRMFHWGENTVIKTFWQKVDAPLRKRTIETVVDSGNLWLNGLQSKEQILGGRLEFLGSDNAVTDLMDGISYFRLSWAPPSPMRDLEFIFKYDPEYFENLWS